MRHLVIKAVLGVLVLGLVPSFAYADHHRYWNGGGYGGRYHGGSSWNFSFGFGAGYPAYGYYPRAYVDDWSYPQYYPSVRYYSAPVYRYDYFCPPVREYRSDYYRDYAPRPSGYYYGGGYRSYYYDR